MKDTRTWAYRRGADGEIEGKIFASPEDVPLGWVDSPAFVPKIDVKEAPDAPKKRGRPKNADR